MWRRGTTKMSSLYSTIMSASSDCCCSCARCACLRFIGLCCCLPGVSIMAEEEEEEEEEVDGCCCWRSPPAAPLLARGADAAESSAAKRRGKCGVCSDAISGGDTGQEAKDEDEAEAVVVAPATTLDGRGLSPLLPLLRGGRDGVEEEE